MNKINSTVWKQWNFVINYELVTSFVTMSDDEFTQQSDLLIFKIKELTSEVALDAIRWLNESLDEFRDSYREARKHISEEVSSEEESEDTDYKEPLKKKRNGQCQK